MNSNSSNYMRPNFKPQYENFIGGDWFPQLKAAILKTPLQLMAV